MGLSRLGCWFPSLHRSSCQDRTFQGHRRFLVLDCCQDLRLLDPRSLPGSKSLDPKPRDCFQKGLINLQGLSFQGQSCYLGLNYPDSRFLGLSSQDPSLRDLNCLGPNCLGPNCLDQK